MAQYELSVQDYLRIFKKQSLIIILTTVMVYAFTYIYTQMQPKVYQAASTIKLMTRQTIGGVIDQQQPIRGVRFYNSSVEDIKSERVLTKVLLELQNKDKVPKHERFTSGFQQQINSLKNLISVSHVAKTDLINIAVRDQDRELAAEIANTVAEVYRFEDMQMSKEQDIAVRVYINEQLERLESQIAADEQELIEFKQSYGISVLPQSAQGLSSEISSLELEIEKLRKARQELLIKKETVEKIITNPQFESLINFADMLNNSYLNTIKNNVLSLRTRYENILKEYTENHPDVIELREEIQANLNRLYQTAVGHAQSEMDRLDNEIRAKNNEINLITSRLSRLQRKEEEFPFIVLRLSKLQRKLDINNQMYAMFLKRYEELSMSEAGRIGGVEITSLAAPPTRPIYPKVQTNILAGTLIGLILGIAFAFVAESMDTSIGTIEDVEEYIKKPVVGVIPLIKVNMSQRKNFKSKVIPDGTEINERHLKLVALSNPKAPSTEAYRILRTNLQYSFLKGEKQIKTILFTSATPQEGKSTTLANLAVMFAQVGKKTALLGCNLRHPSVYKSFNLKKKPGMTDILIGAATWREVVQDPGIDNLSVISAGPYPPNPSELLASDKYDELLADLKDNFDVILIDSPPILPVTDGLVISSKVDAVVLVYYAGKAARETLMRAKIQLENINSNVLGVVLNYIKPEGKLGYTYYYHYQYKYYGPKEEAI